MPFLSLVTLTFKLVRARNQTRLPCEFGANPFSGSQYISYANKKTTDWRRQNRTFRRSLRAVKITTDYHGRARIRACVLQCDRDKDRVSVQVVDVATGCHDDDANDDNDDDDRCSSVRRRCVVVDDGANWPHFRKWRTRVTSAGATSCFTNRT